jgi:hypothetical protein
MAASINKIINIQSQAISAGSNGFNLAGMILDENPIIPFNTILTFTSALSVGNYFGQSSNEYKYAQNYFTTYINNINTPSFIKYSRFITIAVGAWVRGGKLNTTANLISLQAITAGSLSVIFEGVTYTATGINLTGLTYSAMAAAIQTKLQIELATLTVTWDSVTSAFTIFNSVVDGAVDYPTSTPLSDAMLITQSKGAVLSQGSTSLTPAENMNNIINQDTNWFNFTTLFTIYNEDLYVTALALIKWLEAQTLQFAYTYWSLETSLTAGSPTGFALAAIAAGYASLELNGKGIQVVKYNVNVLPLYGNLDLAHAIMGSGAAIDYSATNGTISFNAKTFAGIATLVNDDDTFDSLIANGFNFYTSLSARGNTYNFSEIGTIGGNFLWIDALYNDAWQNNAQTVGLANLQASLPKLPANDIGAGYVNSVLIGVANEAINNGTIGIGNTFTPDVIAQLKVLAGLDISNILTNAGYYIKITIDRANRILNYLYFYTASGAIVYINGDIIAVL